MQTEPLNVSILTGKIAVATAALTHGLFATFVVGTTLIAAIIATVAYFNRKEPYMRLSRTLAFTLVLTTATVSFMGVVLVFMLNIYWPRFWSAIFRIMFWPFILEATFFLGEAVFIYAWYCTWAWSALDGWRRRSHLAFVWIGTFFALIAMVMIDMVASYMLTPAPQNTASIWPKLFNAIFLHLDIHRFFGNLAWARSRSRRSPSPRFSWRCRIRFRTSRTLPSSPIFGSTRSGRCSRTNTLPSPC